MYVKTVTRTRTLVAKRQRRTGTCELRFHHVSLNSPNLELRNLTKLGICLLPSIMTRRLRRKMMLWTNVKPLRPISSAITLRTTGHSGFYRRRTHCGRYARGSFVRWAASSFTEHGRRRSRTPSSSLSYSWPSLVGSSSNRSLRPFIVGIFMRNMGSRAVLGSILPSQCLGSRLW
jgi:hypothetical protein